MLYVGEQEVTSEEVSQRWDVDAFLKGLKDGEPNGIGQREGNDPKKRVMLSSI